MAGSQIAVQMYTLRDFAKTPADIATTLKRVKQMGFDAVQVSGIGKIDPKELANILQGEGLTCCVTHIGLDRMKNETQAVIDEHKLWGCKYTAIGGYWPQKEREPVTKDWVEFAKDFSDVAKKLSAGGLKLGYHNHNHEMAPFDGKAALQHLIDHCSQDVWFEIDTYWIAAGLGDPAEWINKVKGRIPCVHLKDGFSNMKRELVMAEVGEGNLNWPAILKACRDAGVEWYIIEQDRCERDPFESLAISLKNLKEMGIR